MITQKTGNDMNDKSKPSKDNPDREYISMTFDEYCKYNDPKGKVFIFCKNCGTVLDDRGIPLLDIRTCPRCKSELKENI